jgi:hypothetical protein
MLRRAVQLPSASFSVSSAAAATGARRTYFSAGTGEVGIWGRNMGTLISTLSFACFVALPIFMYKVVYRRYNPDKQWIAMSTDKWYSDGTVMKGDEAHANLRIQRERIMPIMDQYLQKIEEAQNAGH